MVKRKPRSTIKVADGSGELAQVPDRRFEDVDDWPIQFEVPTDRDQADTWPRYLNAECEKRGWSNSGLAQVERIENSGSITVNTGPGNPQLAIVWERKRDPARNAGGKLAVRARSVGVPEFPLTEVQDFFEQINERCRSGIKDCAYRRGDLQYDDGLAWRSELWLDDTLRLGPPRRQDDTAERGPRIVHVDTMLEYIAPSDAPWALRQRLDELSVFLSVIIRKFVRRAEQGRAWTWITGVDDCAVRAIGYLSPENPLEMPTRGAERTIPLVPVVRPYVAAQGVDLTEQWLPADVTDLWRLYRGLPLDRRRQFLKAAAKFQEATMHWAERPTLSFALMVVACEALKPPEKEFKDHNHYHVVEALLGKAIREQLQQHPFPSEQVRGAHLHLGELHGSEFLEMALLSSYEDPSFRDACSALFMISSAAIIEWLRLRGTITMPPRKYKARTWRRWVKDHALILIPMATAIGVGLGWLIRALGAA